MSHKILKIGDTTYKGSLSSAINIFFHVHLFCYWAVTGIMPDQSPVIFQCPFLSQSNTVKYNIYSCKWSGMSDKSTTPSTVHYRNCSSGIILRIRLHSTKVNANAMLFVISPLKWSKNLSTIDTARSLSFSVNNSLVKSVIEWIMAIEMTVRVKRSLLECIDRNPVWNLCWKCYQSETWSDTFPWQGGCIHHFVGDANGIKIRDLPFSPDWKRFSQLQLDRFTVLKQSLHVDQTPVLSFGPRPRSPMSLARKFFNIINMDKCLLNTRMHYSRMRTGRSLTVCRSLLPEGVCSGGGVFALGVSAVWGVSALGGCLLLGGVCSGGGGVSALGEGYLVPVGVGIPACTEADTPPFNRMTDTCKNITLAQLRCGR